jgi:hypothetical protein
MTSVNGPKAVPSDDGSPLMELIERLEKATGPDRELGNQALLACGWKRWREDRIYLWEMPGARGITTAYPPDPTASLDAAVTLVPEGWIWQASNRAPKPHTGRAYIHNGELVFVGIGGVRNPSHRAVEVTAITPAIALCIAALKARLSKVSP